MAFAYETYKLPSNGKLGNGVPAEVTLRNMTTAEEKLLLGSTSDSIDLILKKCIVSPENLEFGNLISADKHFLLFKLRIISYGNEYFVSYRCPSCKKIHEYKINLDELIVHYLDDDFKEPYDTFNLPDSNIEISLKIPRVSDLEAAERKSKRFMKKFPEAQGDISYIYGLMANIDEVDGEKKNDSELQKLIEGLSAKDSSYLRNRISKIKVGLDTIIEEECPKCGEDVKFALPITSEFFHTRFED